MFSLLNKTTFKSPVSKRKFEEIKSGILGKKYELSLVLVNNSQSKKINQKNRQKNKPANVLSFPIENNFGEIFIDLQTKEEAEKFEMGYKKYLTYLFIHGCLHLKGYNHGEKMEKEEDKFLKKFH